MGGEATSIAHAAAAKGGGVPGAPAIEGPLLTYAVPERGIEGVDLQWDGRGGVAVRIAARPLWRQIVERVAEMGVVTLCFTAPVSVLAFMIVSELGFHSDILGMLVAALICLSVSGFTLVRLVNVCRFGRLPTRIEASAAGLRVRHWGTWGMRERVWPREMIADVDAEYAQQTGSLRYAVQLKVRSTAGTFRLNLNSSDWIFQEKLRTAMKEALGIWRAPVEPSPDSPESGGEIRADSERG